MKKKYLYSCSDNISFTAPAQTAKPTKQETIDYITSTS
jgi:hypothetical protein